MELAKQGDQAENYRLTILEGKVQGVVVQTMRFILAFSGVQAIFSFSTSDNLWLSVEIGNRTKTDSER